MTDGSQPIKWTDPEAARRATDLISLFLVDGHKYGDEEVARAVRASLIDVDPVSLVSHLIGFGASLFQLYSDPNQPDKTALFRQFVEKFERDLERPA